VWDISFVNGLNGDEHLLNFAGGSFITCSQDHSIKIWNVDVKALKLNPLVGSSNGLSISMDLAPEETADLHSTSQVDASLVCDLSHGIPDFELPERPYSASSPRCLSVHPLRRHAVSGDRTGRLRCFDLDTHKELEVIQAHSSEILTLCFSPVLAQAPDGEWSIDVESADRKLLVLLASAGRDRLIHIYDASEGSYKHLTTLDHHSSSVTAVKFTSDGKRLLSCGGDKTIVFHAVNGPFISKLKSVSTPHGTINGLAVDPINKFAVTCGQDKRLNIWNVSTGKHVRSYKHESVGGELYRSDIDPSGTPVINLMYCMCDVLPCIQACMWLPAASTSLS
jgi:WD40 repeat protein